MRLSKHRMLTVVMKTLSEEVGRHAVQANLRKASSLNQANLLASCQLTGETLVAWHLLRLALLLFVELLIICVKQLRQLSIMWIGSQVKNRRADNNNSSTNTK